MMTSNSSDPVSTDTATPAASGAETSVHSSGVTAPAPMPDPIAAASGSLPDPNTKESLKGLDLLKDQSKKAAMGPAGSVGASGAPGTEIPKSVFQPNFKYKAFGKEREIDEFWRGLIKDQESEKKVKDIFTQAHAFEDMKIKQDGTAKEFQELLGEHQALDKDVKKVMAFRNNRDFDNFFQSLRITDQEVFDWVQKKLNLMEQSPEARQMADQQVRERQKVYDISQENESLQRQYQTQADQARAMQLDMVLSRQDVARTASFFDDKSGRIGAFRELVIEEAIKHYYATGGDNGGRDLSAEEATQMVMQKFGKFFEAPQAQQMSQVAIAPGPQVQAKPVIPAATGRGTSPIKKAPKSLDDLRALAKEARALEI